MNTIPYTYSIIRYVHDPGVGEMLNVGVILCAPTINLVETRFEYRYERLSEAFMGFDGDYYRRSIRHFGRVIDALRERLKLPQLFDVWDFAADVQSITKEVWPDPELSFQVSSVMTGITDNPHEAIESLFHRMVTSQYLYDRAETKTDDEVWTFYQEPLIERRVIRKLRPTTLATKEIEIKFEHAFRNERWHVLQPMSMDYVRKENIQRKATTWLGNAVALGENRELDTMYILLGPPELESHRVAYEKAKSLLNKIPIKHHLIEEDAAEDFADHIASYMRQHGVDDNG
jgi:Protein of unknown function (DUF3037)